MNELLYRENCKVSAKQIADLRQSLGWNRMENVYSDESMNSYFHIACYDGGKLVGFVDCVSNGVSDAYIQDLMVANDYQSRGIGTKLVELVIAKTRKDGIYMVSVIFEEHLRKFYKKFGFREAFAGQLQNFISF